MPRLTPIAHQDFIRRLRLFGFNGPYPGGKHLFMLREDTRLTIPNPHRKQIGMDLLQRLLRQAGIAKEEWIAKG